VLAAAAKLGIWEVYAVGGAQAIAAMAFGTATIRAVDKIVGPGNTFVQLAKKELYGIVDIDSFAGPSEVIVLADDSASPQQVAAELLAQAEHAPGSCLLITASDTLAKSVQQELESQLQKLSRQALARRALEFASALIVTGSHEEAIALTDAFAPEHLQITTREAREDAQRVQHAGAIFIGPYTPVAAGDYLAGPSHVLPTSGTARFFSGLSADSFRKRTSLIEFNAQALDALGQPIVDFATVEGFDAHAKSVRIRAGG
jgi:histidinol dehydrogenase